jgi:hypothetical protein
MSSLDNKHENVASHQNTPAMAANKHETNRSLAGPDRDLDHLARSLRREPGVDVSRVDALLGQIKHDLKEQTAAVKISEMVSLEQRSALSRLAESIGAGANAAALIADQTKALTALKSELQVRESIARVQLEQTASPRGVQPNITEWLQRNADIGTTAAARTLNDVNARMQKFVLERSTCTGANQIVSLDTKFAVTPEGNIAVFAKPGKSGNIQVCFSSEDRVNVQFHARENGHITWAYQPKGHVSCPSPTIDRNGAAAYFDIRTNDPEVVTTGQVKRADEQKSGVKVNAKGEVGISEIAKLGAGAEYDRSHKQTKETARTESTKKPAEAVHHGIAFEIKLIPEPAKPIQIIRGRASH